MHNGTNAYHIFHGHIEEPHRDNWFLSLSPSIWSAYENAPGPNGQVWQGKEERNECSTTEYITTLKGNMKLVRVMANTERD